MTPQSLDSDTARALAATALANVGRSYPFHLTHLLASRADLVPPEDLHPAFHGSYDWHSSVHMHWALVRLWRALPDAPERSGIARHLDLRLSARRIAGEIAYFQAPARSSFERPYGWGWLLKLQQALSLAACDDAQATAWRDAVAPLATLIAERCIEFLARSQHPVRAGTHGNSAFALGFALQWARAAGHTALANAVCERARSWFGSDRRYPADYEPGGDDFLSGGLTEAVLMRQCLSAAEWNDWWEAFVPAPAALDRWLTPVAVSDAADPKIVHLHGLNLSRAWCWRTLASDLPPAMRPAVRSAIDSHLAASLPAATSGDYVGTHWLASFALLALGADAP